jgi:MFS transporter, DHA2 family, glioxin efflux transporter
MTIISTAIPRITDEFQSLSDIGWYGSSYFMCIAAFQPAWGKLLKYFPIKYVFPAASVGFCLGCIICAVAQNSETLIAGRAVMGALGAGLAPGVYTVIAHIAPPKQKPMYMGALGAVFGIASVIGPPLGGVFTDHATWRWVFWINLPIMAPAIILFLVFFRQPKSTYEPHSTPLKEKILQLDLPGSVIILGSVICYLLAMQEGGTKYAWNSAHIIGLLVGFGLLLILFCVEQYFAGERAVFQGKIVKDRTLVVMWWIAFLITGAFQLVLYYVPVYFQSTRDVSAADSGVNILALVLSCSFFVILAGGVMAFWGRYVELLLIGSVPLCVGAGLLYTLGRHTSTGKYVGYELLLGTGIGLNLQIPMMVAQSIVPQNDVSTVSSIVLWGQTMGSAILVSAGQAGFANKLLDSLPTDAPNVNPLQVLTIGASELADFFNGADLDGVLDAYMEGLKVPFIMTVVVMCLASVIVPIAKPGSIKGKIPM